ncbi:predicted protein [Sclerotinia sclerotiorum 1980 UF-70]|uniref:Uncharacterized protein n=1 Tax=Sclerotinia sclerotiorum (strain ATCC 18683 / 1980 / Ss-1) TaxID=665079 RepID=A7F4K6_SCLS1|nr:predicted protein [Sclerotinia sclerotiorum 1980 UF-70]EDN97677.1 predicted protein [Sclerotinia sclerotiorum 1980 UF-70]
MSCYIFLLLGDRLRYISIFLLSEHRNQVRLIIVILSIILSQEMKIQIHSYKNLSVSFREYSSVVLIRTFLNIQFNFISSRSVYSVSTVLRIEKYPYILYYRAKLTCFTCSLRFRCTYSCNTITSVTILDWLIIFNIPVREQR